MPHDPPSHHSFSSGADNFFTRIHPYGKEGAIWFPPGLRAVDARRRERERLPEWFARIVDGLGADAPDSFAIEEGIGILANVRWVKGSALIYANIQVVVTKGTLLDLCYEPTQPAFYLRLDCDENTLGEPFSHPHPHIHLDDPLGPRFSLDGGMSANVVVDFIEFLYRHYEPASWQAWATRVWSRDRNRRSIDPDHDAFPRMIAAFRENRLNGLREDRQELARLKEVLHLAKEDYSTLRLKPKDRELLEDPAAR